MIQKETFNSAVKNHDFHLLVSFECVMISFISRMASGPRMLSGGWSNVTRQHVGDRLASRICLVFDADEFCFAILLLQFELNSRHATPRRGHLGHVGV